MVSTFEIRLLLRKLEDNHWNERNVGNEEKFGLIHFFFNGKLKIQPYEDAFVFLENLLFCFSTPI